MDQKRAEDLTVAMVEHQYSFDQLARMIEQYSEE
jgi:hypothetical protein